MYNHYQVMLLNVFKQNFKVKNAKTLIYNKKFTVKNQW